MNTPLYSALIEYAQAGRVRFHMPGHKGKPLYGGVWGGVAALDVTELPWTGDLYRELDGPIRRAEALLAGTYGAKHAVFLTGGSTQGIFAMLAAYTKPGDRVLTDRLCHQSIIHAMALLDLTPVYIYRDIVSGVAMPIDGIRTDGVSAAIVTSPTYNGVCSDLGAIYKACEDSGIKLLVDAAHGAHLPFMPGFESYFHYHAVVMSAHKTLPALGQAAFLLTNGDADALRRAAMITGTSSPSYPVMASIDLARAFLDEHGERAGRQLHDMVSRYNLSGPQCLLDPLRINVKCGPERFTDMVPEMSSDDLTTFIVTLYDALDDVKRLMDAALKYGKVFTSEKTQMRAAKFAMPLRQAMLNSRKALVPARDAVGRIAAEPVAPYPPGVALVMPGEIIEAEHVVNISKELLVTD